MPKPPIKPTSNHSKAVRQALEATYPKCECGNTLGLERVRAGVNMCRACLPDQLLERRDALKLLENRALDAKSLDDLVAVVVDLINGLRGGLR